MFCKLQNHLIWYLPFDDNVSWAGVFVRAILYKWLSILGLLYIHPQLKIHLLN